MFRVGQWVMFRKQVAIISAITPEGDGALLDLVNSVGNTFAVTRVELPNDEVRQATFMEIPEVRRPTPEVGARFEYV